MRRIGVDRREVGETTGLQEGLDDGRKGRAERVNAGRFAVGAEALFVAGLLASDYGVAKDESYDGNRKESGGQQTAAAVRRRHFLNGWWSSRIEVCR